MLMTNTGLIAPSCYLVSLVLGPRRQRQIADGDNSMTRWNGDLPRPGQVSSQLRSAQVGRFQGGTATDVLDSKAREVEAH